VTADPFRQPSKPYAAYVKRLRHAWKRKGAATTPQTGDAFLDSLMAVHERYDIGPLLTVLRSDRPLSSTDREQLARLIDLLYALGQARRPGKPGGKHTRWNNPNYIATKLVERRLDESKQASGRRTTSIREKEEATDKVIGEMKGWALTQCKRVPSKRRVLELLREPKNRRL
jgi:hypothetical protein